MARIRLIQTEELGANEVASGQIAANTIVPADVETDFLQYADVQLTNAQVLALNATPITVIAAPGAGRSIVIHRMYGVMASPVTAYTNAGGGDLVLEYADGTDILTHTPGATWLLQIGTVGAHLEPVNTILLVVANSAVRLFKATAEFGAGAAANTFSVRVWYSVVDTAAFS